MPSVCGSIDGTHIQISKPSQNENQFISRYGFPSINAMMVAVPDRQFYFVSARWPGSTNDSRVLRNSNVAASFENGFRPFPDAVLLGDSGYSLKSWLMTPVLNLHTNSEVNYNNSHKNTCYIVEHSFGVIKQRFRCLLDCLRVHPITACEIIKACCILHNFARKSRIINLENYELLEEMDDREHEEEHAEFGAQERRNRLIAMFE